MYVLARHSSVLVCMQTVQFTLCLNCLHPQVNRGIYVYTKGNPGPLLCVLVCVTLFDTLYACNCTLYVDKVLCGCIQLVR